MRFKPSDSVYVRRHYDKYGLRLGTVLNVEQDEPDAGYLYRVALTSGPYRHVDWFLEYELEELPPLAQLADCAE